MQEEMWRFSWCKLGRATPMIQARKSFPSLNARCTCALSFLFSCCCFLDSFVQTKRFSQTLGCIIRSSIHFLRELYIPGNQFDLRARVFLVRFHTNFFGLVNILNVLNFIAALVDWERVRDRQQTGSEMRHGAHRIQVHHPGSGRLRLHELSQWMPHAENLQPKALHHQSHKCLHPAGTREHHVRFLHLQPASLPGFRQWSPDEPSTALQWPGVPLPTRWQSGHNESTDTHQPYQPVPIPQPIS